MVLVVEARFDEKRFGTTIGLGISVLLIFLLRVPPIKNKKFFTCYIGNTINNNSLVFRLRVLIFETIL